MGGARHQLQRLPAPALIICQRIPHRNLTTAVHNWFRAHWRLPDNICRSGCTPASGWDWVVSGFIHPSCFTKLIGVKDHLLILCDFMTGKAGVRQMLLLAFLTQSYVTVETFTDSSLAFSYSNFLFFRRISLQCIICSTVITAKLAECVRDGNILSGCRKWLKHLHLVIGLLQFFAFDVLVKL